jgi:DNA-binding LacI/PurR family transcriptional regulator
MEESNDIRKRVRLKDIAKVANLSVSAVSMALNNDTSMSKQTIERVKRIASEMGYAPDPALAALSAYRSKRKIHTHYSVIGMVTNWSTKGWMVGSGESTGGDSRSGKAGR